MELYANSGSAGVQGNIYRDSLQGYNSSVEIFTGDLELSNETTVLEQEMSFQKRGLSLLGNISAPSFLGNASTATALTTNAGSATQPVYFSNGKPVASTSTVGGTTTPMYLKAGVMTALGYTIAKSVPSGAKFTDENVKYTLATDNQEYRMLMSQYYSTVPTTLGIKYTDNIRINPYASSITATSFLGNATSATSAGNADLANKLTINSSASASWFNIL